MANSQITTWRCALTTVLVSGLSCAPQPSMPKAATSPAPAIIPATPTPEMVSTLAVPGESIEPVATNEKPVEPSESTSTPAEQPIPEGTPLDLTKFYVMHAANFEKIKLYAWKIVPRGQQTFANIPLQLDGAMFTWGERNAKNGQVYAEQIKDIPVGKAFETLYIYHSAFFEGEAGKPIYDVVFQYEDGTSATDSIRNRDDVRDWYVNKDQKPWGPTNKRSTLAWSGDDNGSWVRYCLTAVENPRPERTVKSLDFVSAKMQTAGCIMGLTIGKSGLMVPTKEEETPPGNPTE